MTREELEKIADEMVATLEFMIELPFSRHTISQALAREVPPLLVESYKLGIRYGFEKGLETLYVFKNEGWQLNLRPKYESAEQVIQELEEQPK